MSNVAEGARAPKKSAIEDSAEQRLADYELLLALLAKSERAYEQQLAKWKKEDPWRYRGAVERIRFSLANNDSDIPTTPHEAEDLVRDLVKRTGWSRARVVAEGMFLFDNALDDQRVEYMCEYKAQTNDEKPWRWLPTWAQADDELRWRARRAKEKAGKATQKKVAS